ncbi:MAG: BlaI/MecI/CopY family transcriptional regulator [Bacteroidota bacterium]
MEKLAKREEQIMRVLWQLEKAFVKEIIAELPEPKPHYNTVSTIIRILEDKGYVGHQSFGTTHQYYPIIEKKEEYKKTEVKNVLQTYFSDSPSKMMLHFAKENKLNEEELQEILDMIKKSRQ